MHQFMLSVPDEMLDAAPVDDTSEIGKFLRIELQTIMPGLVSPAIMCCVAFWNNFLWLLAVLRSEENHS